MKITNTGEFDDAFPELLDETASPVLDPLAIKHTSILVYEDNGWRIEGLMSAKDFGCSKRR